MSSVAYELLETIFAHGDCCGDVSSRKGILRIRDLNRSATAYRKEEEGLSGYQSMIRKMTGIQWGEHLLVAMKRNTLSERNQDEFR